MGWEPFDYGDPLNPEKLNSKFEQVYSLLSKAYTYNNLLKRKLDTVNNALAISSQMFQFVEGTPSTLVGDVTSGRRLYNLPISGNDGVYELFIGGEFFAEAGTQTDVSIISSTLGTDGLAAILPTNGDVISRIPLTTNEYGEQKPSLGTSITSTTFDETKLYNILSPSAVWAEVASIVALEELELEEQLYNIGVVEFTLPDSLSPYMNKLSITPLIGTAYRLLYYAGDAGKVVSDEMKVGFVTGASTFFIERDIFDGRLRLELLGATIPEGQGFGIMSLGAEYCPFADSGESKIEYTLSSANININIKEITNDQEMPEETMLSIYTDALFTQQIYNSVQDGFPFSGSVNATNIDKLYIKLEMEKKNGTTPTFPYLKIKYEDTT